LNSFSKSLHSRIVNPILHVPNLKTSIAKLYEEHQLQSVVELDVLQKGAELAKSEHLLNIGMYERIIKKDSAEERAITQQRSLKIHHDPKEMVLTLIGCCLASLTQGWDQMATGNLGWPSSMGLNPDIVAQPGAHDAWIFGIVNAIVWFVAAVTALFITDPLQSRLIGRYLTP
jgi:hypothetical protein